MLHVTDIRDHKEDYINALTKRNFDATEVFEQVLSLDEKRRSTQASLDNTLAESNKLSKEIGMLFKNGEAQKANLLKERTGKLKEDSK
ncbi:MAG TPA: serine--tRNA ligase, partial [Leeuwenhoekiella sp.]|nr:serine--tRNA ligase [Leeuwenhoekiella sp.]